MKNYYKSNVLDILFLDIHMNELSGMDTARKIREFDNNVEIIFTTSIPQYVYEAYDVKAYRYLLKPLDYDDILETINNIKAMEMLSLKKTTYYRLLREYKVNKF